MKIQVLQENLLKILTKAGRIITTKTQLPVLQNLLLESHDNWLSVTSTNMETTIVTAIAVKEERSGKACVSAKLLTELVTSLPAETITLTEDNAALTVSAPRSKSVLTGMPPGEYPIVDMNQSGDAMTVDAALFKQILSQTAFAAATDEGRPLLTGIKVKPVDGGTVFAATDGYRLSVKQVDRKMKTLTDAVVPARTMLEVAKIAGEDKDVEKITIGKTKEGQLLFVIGETRVATRKIDGEYPDFERIIPKNHTTQADIEKSAMVLAVKSAAIFARDNANIVKLAFSDSGLVISANAPQVGSNTLDVDAAVTGDGGEIAFNSRFLLELLSNFPGEKVVFQMTGSLNPGVFLSPQDPSFTHIIMPVRLQG